MTAIGFYHLTKTTAEAALPKLLARTLDAGERAVIRATTPDYLATLDRTLWLGADDWLPHGTDQADLQPIYLTLADEHPNAARFLFLLEGANSAKLPDYTRVFDLFDGANQPALAAARHRWTTAKQAGHTLTYWQQDAGGKWVKATT